VVLGGEDGALVCVCVCVCAAGCTLGCVSLLVGGDARVFFVPIMTFVQKCLCVTGTPPLPYHHYLYVCIDLDIISLTHT